MFLPQFSPDQNTTAAAAAPNNRPIARVPSISITPTVTGEMRKEPKICLKSRTGPRNDSLRAPRGFGAGRRRSLTLVSAMLTLDAVGLLLLSTGVPPSLSLSCPVPSSPSLTLQAPCSPPSVCPLPAARGAVQMSSFTGNRLLRMLLHLCFS